MAGLDVDRLLDDLRGYAVSRAFDELLHRTSIPTVGRFLRLFTKLPIAEIKKLETLDGAERNEAKKTLATCLA